MGSELSALRGKLTGGDDAAKEAILQQLNFLSTMVNAKLDKYQSTMEQDFLTSDLRSKTSIAGHRAMRWERGYRIGVSKKATNGINEIVDAFFGDKEEETAPEDEDEKDDDDKGKNKDDKKDNGENDDKKDDKSKVDKKDEGDKKKAKPKRKMEDRVLNGFKKVVNVALDVILGNTQVGEQEDIKYFVFARHNAVIRVDLRMWRYNFIGRGVMAQAENVFCFIFCTSVVRHETMIVDEIVYLMSEHGGDENVHAYLERLLATWTMMERFWSQYEKKELDQKKPDQLPPRPKLVLKDSPPPDEVLTDLEKDKSKAGVAGAPSGVPAGGPSSNSPVAGPSTGPARPSVNPSPPETPETPVVPAPIAPLVDLSAAPSETPGVPSPSTPSENPEAPPETPAVPSAGDAPGLADPENPAAPQPPPEADTDNESNSSIARRGPASPMGFRRQRRGQGRP